MPSFVSQSGFVATKRPGIYTKIDASSLSGGGASVGNVALVGPFPSFPYAEPVQYFSRRALAAHDSTDQSLALLAQLLFAPSQDADVQGGASTVRIVNTTRNGQPEITFGALKLKSRVYGARGERLRVSLAANATDAAAYDLTLSRAGVSEEYQRIGGEDVASLTYSGNASAGATLTTSQNGLSLSTEHEITCDGSGAAVEGDDLYFSGVVTFTAANVQVNATTIEVEGINTDGEAVTLSLEIDAGDQSVSTPSALSLVSEITISSANAGEIITVSGQRIEITSADSQTVGGAIALINQLPDFSAQSLSARAVEIGALDYYSALAIGGVAVEIKADAQALLSAVASSALVEAERVYGAVLSTGSGFAQGAALGASGFAEFEAALSAIENQDVQIVVLWSQTDTIQALISPHLRAAAQAGFERQAYTAIPSTLSLSDAGARTRDLNEAGIAVAAQKPTLINSRGAREEASELHLALIFAAMQAGSDVGMPLTRKRPNILSVSSSWDPYHDAEQALSSGICFCSVDALGPRVERGITTYQTDDNPIYSEISAYESILASLRDLRAALADQIGQPTKASQVPLIDARVKATLSRQVAAGTIKAFQGVTLEDLGDTIAISYEVAPVEPLNFVTITAVATRISA